MGTLTTFVCNACGKQRASDTNHWRHVYVLKTGAGSLNSAGIFFMEWNASAVALRDAHGEASAHVCGGECAAKIFSRWLSTGSIEESKAGVADA